MSEEHWTGLVIAPDDRLDNDLLLAITLATGSTFEPLGRDDLGIVYAAGPERIIEVECAEVGAKALFIRTRSLERTSAIIDSIDRHTRTWTEQLLCTQLEQSLAEDPYALVSLLMATGGMPPRPATSALLARAVEHPDEQVRKAADYAIRISKAWTSFRVVS
ncbi:hypothetical protein [Kribbella rubisoli]|uniref:hypothetical protein n=1 Tax=Kribbella rubisoli TaxID=3075929 RepID=UPI00102C3F72|nr:hypothetical protein [Kribbella rubisoli]